MLAIIYLWPTQDSPMHPLVLQCTLEQDRHLIPPHTEVDDKIEWAHSQFNHLLPLVLLRLEDPQSRRLHEHTALWLAC